MVIKMCGIIGVINENSQEKIIKGLLKMEYRGYDSCGIAYFKNNNINNINRGISNQTLFEYCISWSS